MLDIILIAGLLILVFFVIRYLAKQRKNKGSGCHGSCAGCSGCSGSIGCPQSQGSLKERS